MKENNDRPQKAVCSMCGSQYFNGFPNHYHDDCRMNRDNKGKK